jgi:hypothetical protein
MVKDDVHLSLKLEDRIRLDDTAIRRKCSRSEIVRQSVAMLDEVTRRDPGLVDRVSEAWSLPVATRHALEALDEAMKFHRADAERIGTGAGEVYLLIIKELGPEFVRGKQFAIAGHAAKPTIEMDGYEFFRGPSGALLATRQGEDATQILSVHDGELVEVAKVPANPNLN